MDAGQSALERTFARRLVAARCLSFVGAVSLAVGEAQQYVGYFSRSLAFALMPWKWPAFFAFVASLLGYFVIYRCPACRGHLGFGLSSFKTCKKCGASFAPG
ncbi:MAG: hypothetical protein ACXWUG_31830 [Polyangiales bacterium]